MTLVVGFSPHKDDLGALELACQLGRSDSTDVLAVTVVPQGWPTAVAGDTDREYERWAAEEGRAAVAVATEAFATHGDVPSTATWVRGRSVPPTLLDAAEREQAAMLVVGSGDEIAHGKVGITSKTDRLMHSSRIPVAIAPRGYHAAPDAVVQRITLAFRGDDTTWSLLQRVAEIAHRTGASLRIVTFAVRARTMSTTRVSGAEDMVLESWIRAAETEQAAAKQHLAESGFGDRLEFEIAVGRSWGAAMDGLEWHRGDVLVVGSSSTHRLARVFLGSSASKILRHSPVPVIVVP